MIVIMLGFLMSRLDFTKNNATATKPATLLGDVVPVYDAEEHCIFAVRIPGVCLLVCIGIQLKCWQMGWVETNQFRHQELLYMIL